MFGPKTSAAPDALVAVLEVDAVVDPGCTSAVETVRRIQTTLI